MHSKNLSISTSVHSIGLEKLKSLLETRAQFHPQCLHDALNDLHMSQLLIPHDLAMISPPSVEVGQ